MTNCPIRALTSEKCCVCDMPVGISSVPPFRTVLIVQLCQALCLDLFVARVLNSVLDLFLYFPQSWPRRYAMREFLCEVGPQDGGDPEQGF